MRVSMIAAGLAAALLAGAGPAQAEDNEAGVPLTPAEAAGTWTIESAGHALCTVTLSATHTVKGPATYEHEVAALRGDAAATIQ